MKNKSSNNKTTQPTYNKMETIAINAKGNETQNNKTGDNIEWLKETEYAIKEEQWIILQKMVKPITEIKKKMVVQNRFQEFEDESKDKDD